MATQVNSMALSTQWMNRPDDERFLSLDDLYETTLARADASRVDLALNREIEIVHNGDNSIGLTITTQRGELDASLTHWSFGQLAARAQVPATWAREKTHPEIATLALNYGLQVKNPKEDVQFYSYVNDEGLAVRAATSSTYGRIYDHQVVDAVRQVNEDGYWAIPQPTRYLKPGAEAMVSQESALRRSTLYASDRDVWLFLTDQQRPIEVKRPDGATEMLYRGFYAWNSEVGSATFGVAWFLYRDICENRILWGVEGQTELRIRHTSGGPERFLREGRQVLADYAASSDQQSVATIQRAMAAKVGNTDDDVASWLTKRGNTMQKARAIIQQAKIEEGKAETVWDLVQGGTSLARAIPHTDARVQAERQASKLLASV